MCEDGLTVISMHGWHFQCFACGLATVQGEELLERGVVSASTPR